MEGKSIRDMREKSKKNEKKNKKRKKGGEWKSLKRCEENKKIKVSIRKGEICEWKRMIRQGT